MKALDLNPSLTQRVYDAIVDEILQGGLQAGEHLVQEQLAARLGVSRQPIQQAMALLKADGLVEDAGRRGLRVAALDLKRMRGHYDIRSLLDGYAARATTETLRSGGADLSDFRARAQALLDAGAVAVKTESVTEQILNDEGLHKLIYQCSGNPVLSDMAEPNWRYLRRVMADVLRYAEPASAVWQQHRQIVDAILSGDADRAEALAIEHVTIAANRLMTALEVRSSANAPKNVAG